MSATRLTFLYPRLFRTARPSSTAVRCACPQRAAPVAPRLRCPHSASFASSTLPARAEMKRHGKAVEPQLPGEGPSSTPTPPSTQSAAPATAPPPTSEPARPPEQTTAETTSSEGEAAEETPAADVHAAGPKPGDAPPVIELGAPPETQAEARGAEDAAKRRSGPMEAMLSEATPPAAAERAAPYLTAPPYVHHFDSYSLVKQLSGGPEAGPFTGAQAITTMKAVRGLLAHNLDAAQAGLVGKADVSNEAYLFAAACSELAAEVRNGRRLADEALRTQRTTLTHELEVLAQGLNHELLRLTDAVRGMFNDRQMAARQEQKAIESAIQQINYKIIIMLNSEAKSDIERLRGVLIRRAILGIIFMAALTLGTLQYASYLGHIQEREDERRARDAEAALKKGQDVATDRSPPTEAAETLAAS